MSNLTENLTEEVPDLVLRPEQPSPQRTVPRTFWDDPQAWVIVDKAVTRLFDLGDKKFGGGHKIAARTSVGVLILLSIIVVAACLLAFLDKMPGEALTFLLGTIAGAALVALRGTVAQSE